MPVPAVFLRDQLYGDPPLARMIRAGRADVRLGVYLCLLARATRAPFDVRHNLTPAAWAEMLRIKDPKGKGARRVTSAFKWLEKERLVTLQRRAGRPPLVQLMDPAGSGGPFETGGYWVQVPHEFWLRGWIFSLRETSQAVLLALLDLLYKADAPRFVTPERHDEYGLSDDTWTRGIRDLSECKLLTVRRVPIGDDWHYDRLRNTYSIDMRRLGDSPGGRKKRQPQPTEPPNPFS
ncbi:hypothetical protein ACFT2C_04105 [Promicromonospora sp. NPDC057138]|uniref:hypothetical protein n=1 Tax=Promicromonospora sp. NPDC057138 TaxID=3346031 RepID=UPI003628CA06